MRDHQKNGIRINDPNNPGRIYISGKGLDYPFNPGLINRAKLSKVIRASQNQMKAMISKLNLLIEPVNPSMILSYEKIKGSFARDLVRERHIARAVRSAAFENYSSPEDQTRFIESLYGGKKSAAGLADNALLENEIRSNLLKNGGSAYVEEDKSTFLDIYSILGIIIKAGGIPCYPVLLDDQTERFTDFEQDPEKLHKALGSLKIGCIELIPHRNDLTILRNFIEYFYEKNYLVLIGTEHNTPEMLPLTVTARGNEQLDDDLKQIAWNSVCVIAAHQYLRAQGRQGYVLPDGNPSLKQKRELTFLGKLVIEYFLLNK
jgi:hypothetical protein